MQVDIDQVCRHVTKYLQLYYLNKMSKCTISDKMALGVCRGKFTYLDVFGFVFFNESPIRSKQPHSTPIFKFTAKAFLQKLNRLMLVNKLHAAATRAVPTYHHRDLRIPHTGLTSIFTHFVIKTYIIFGSTKKTQRDL